MNTRLHLLRARRAWPILVQAAARRTPLTYGELTAKMGLHWRAAGWFLGVIQRHCAAEGEPRLQAFAVNKQTRRPGKGDAGKRGASAHERELNRAHAHRWSKIPPF